MSLHPETCICLCHQGGRCGSTACCDLAGLKWPEFCETEAEKEEAEGAIDLRKLMNVMSGEEYDRD